MNQPNLFELPPKQRAKPRKLMHVSDAGGSDDPDSTTDLVRLRCSTCGHETEWKTMKRAEAKRGVPCPKCN